MDKLGRSRNEGGSGANSPENKQSDPLTLSLDAFAQSVLGDEMLGQQRLGRSGRQGNNPSAEVDMGELGDDNLSG